MAQDTCLTPPQDPTPQRCRSLVYTSTPQPSEKLLSKQHETIGQAVQCAPDLVNWRHIEYQPLLSCSTRNVRLYPAPRESHNNRLHAASCCWRTQPPASCPDGPTIAYNNELLPFSPCPRIPFNAMHESGSPVARPPCCHQYETLAAYSPHGTCQVPHLQTSFSIQQAQLPCQVPGS